MNKPHYILKWRLRDTDGKTWIEEHERMTLQDFEIVYGDNIHEILWATIRQENQAII